MGIAMIDMVIVIAQDWVSIVCHHACWVMWTVESAQDKAD